MKNNVKKLTTYALFGAMALVLSALEGLIPPLPILPPGAKAGFSNIIVMFSIGSVGLPCALFIVLLKAVFTLLTRGVTAFLMSLLGGLFSMIVMYLLYKKTKLSLLGIGVISAFFHNLAQICTAYFITGAGVLFYMPQTLIFGIFSGIAMGLILKILYPLLQKLFKQISKGHIAYL